MKLSRSVTAVSQEAFRRVFIQLGVPNNYTVESVRSEGYGSVMLVLHDKGYRATVDGLFKALKHGDKEHQRWLKDALERYFAGRPITRPKGKT